MNLLEAKKGDVKESKIISRYLSTNKKEIEIEILVGEVIYLLISKPDMKLIYKIGKYTETSNYIERTNFDRHKTLYYSDHDLSKIFNHLV